MSGEAPSEQEVTSFEVFRRWPLLLGVPLLVGIVLSFGAPDQPKVQGFEAEVTLAVTPWQAQRASEVLVSPRRAETEVANAAIVVTKIETNRVRVSARAEDARSARAAVESAVAALDADPLWRREWEQIEAERARSTEEHALVNDLLRNITEHAGLTDFTGEGAADYITSVVSLFELSHTISLRADALGERWMRLPESLMISDIQVDPLLTVRPAPRFVVFTGVIIAFGLLLAIVWLRASPRMPRDFLSTRARRLAQALWSPTLKP